MNYYNDNDPFAAQWLRNLIGAGLIPKGYVDERSITEVDPETLRGFTQCHFFAGISGWPFALSLAGWPADEPVWTASCPCQPLSCAGKQLGEKDERHLWPELYRLVSQYRPVTIFGEQVASPDGLEWLDGISLDLEDIGYAVGSVDLPSAGVGAPNIRQRLFWLADSSDGDGWTGERAEKEGVGAYEKRRRGPSSRGANGRVGFPDRARRNEGFEAGAGTRYGSATESASGDGGGLGNTEGFGRIGRQDSEDGRRGQLTYRHSSPWDRYQIVQCTDGKSRRIPVEPALFPLASRLPQRLGVLRGAGNAINPWVAAEFIAAFIEVRNHRQEFE